MTFAARPNWSVSSTSSAALPSIGIYDNVYGSASATLFLYLTNSGTWYSTGTSSTSGTWKTGTDAVSNYWVNFSLSSGILNADPSVSDLSDTWLQMTTTRKWGNTIYAVSDNFVVGTLSISSSSSGSPVLATCSVSLSMSAGSAAGGSLPTGPEGTIFRN